MQSVSKIKSIKDGPNDTCSQLGGIIKAARSERLGNHESTKEAIQYALDENKSTILKAFKSMDKNSNKISKPDFLRVLKAYSIFPSPQAISKTPF